MDNGIWWLLVPGVVSHAILNFLVYEVLRWWPFSDALAVGDIQTLSPKMGFKVWLSTLASVCIAFALTYWMASLAVSRYFEPSSKLYRRANKLRGAARQAAAGRSVGNANTRWYEAQVSPVDC